MPFSDPEVRAKCPVCHGPVYLDEPGYICPDCRLTLAQIAAAHRQDSADAWNPLGRHRLPPSLGRAAVAVRVSRRG